MLMGRSKGLTKARNSRPEVFFGKSVLKIAANLQENTNAEA